MSGPNIRRKIVVRKPVSAVDLAPTILDLAGVKPAMSMDGRSFKDHVFGNTNKRGRTGGNQLLIQYWGEGDATTVDDACNLHSGDVSVSKAYVSFFINL